MDPQQCHCALSREQFLLNNLYDKQTDNFHLDRFALNPLLFAFLLLFNQFGDERKVKNGSTILHIFLIQPGSLKQRSLVARVKHKGTTDSSIDLLITAVISDKS